MLEWCGKAEDGVAEMGAALHGEKVAMLKRKEQMAGRRKNEAAGLA